MNAMTDFDFEVKEKKSVANSAKKRVGHSRKCTMPSDYLSESEKRKLNGNISTVNTNVPMPWELFRNLPTTLQQEYIESLVSRFHVGVKTVSQVLFNRGGSTLGLHLRRYGISVKGHRGQISDENMARFVTFCKLGNHAENETECEPEPGEPEQAKENPTVVNESEAEHTSDVDSWAFTFRDVNDMKDILMLIRNLPLPRNATVHISVYDGKEGEI